MDPSELRERAVSAFAKGRFAKAAELYEAYCAQAPKDSQAWIRLGDAWSRLRKKDKAVAAYYQAAKLYADSGFFPRAIAACKLVLEIEPEHSGVKGMLEKLYEHKTFPRAPSALPPLTRPTPSVLQVELLPKAELSVPTKPSGLALSPPASEIASKAAAVTLPEKRVPETLPSSPIPTLVGTLLQESPSPPPKASAHAQEAPKPLKPPALGHASLSWAEAMKPPRIRPAHVPAPAAKEAKTEAKAEVKAEAKASSAGAFHAIEDAAKAGLEAQGENPQAWLSLAKHAAPSTGLPLDIPLFSDLPQPALIALFKHCPLRRFAPGTFVIAQGESGNSFFIICSGEVRVFRKEAGEPVELASLKEGEFFGEMALLTGKPRSAFVEAVEADTQVLEISADALAELSRKFPQVSSALWRFYRQRLLSNVMASSALFRPFVLEERQRLIRCFQAVDVEPLTEVVRQNQMSEGLFVVLAGHVEVVKEGKKTASLKEGELFGEISLLTKAPATASVIAVERSALLKLPASDFNTLISTHPQVLELLSQLMEERMNVDEVFSLESLGWENEDLELLI